MTKFLYKPFSLLTGVVGGLVARALFKRAWRVISRGAEPPAATRADRSWAEVLMAATLEGAVYALVKAALDRAGAIGFKSVTGTWPGPSGER